MPGTQARWIDLTEARRLRTLKHRDGLTISALAERAGRHPAVIRAALARLEAVEAARAEIAQHQGPTHADRTAAAA